MTSENLIELPLQPAAGVVRAIAAVMAKMPAIGKDSKAPANMGGYAFRGIEAVTRALQPIFAEHGVVITPHCRITKVTEAPGSDKKWQDVYVEVDWTIYGPDGSFITATTSGIGRDHTDKGSNKAQTQAYKYLLMHMLCIADAKDDGDGHDYPADTGDAEQYEKERRAAKVKGMFERLKNLPDAAKAELKDLAKAQGQKLTETGLAASDDWLGTVTAEVERLEHAEVATEGPEPTTTTTQPPLADVDRENSEHNHG